MNSLMTLTELIRQLARLGIGLETAAGRLRLVAPEDAAVDAELLQAVSGHKAGLLAFVVAGTLQCEQLALIGEWLAEAEIMRRGDNPDWLQWSAGCRAEWARQMLETALEDDFLQATPQEVQAWLRQTAQATARQQALSPIEPQAPKHAASAAAGK